jgi:hypothetical protein
MAKFRHRPTVVDAIQWDGTNFQDVSDFVRKTAKTDVRHPAENGDIPILTLEDGAENSWTAKHVASEGDWIVRGTVGEVYAVKPRIFAQTYEAVEE